MRLVAFTVENYRSITTAHKLRVTDLTVLLGPNNEGKSNLLLALVLAMSILTRHGSTLFRRPAGPSGAKPASGPQRLPTRLIARDYQWERDFPVHLQESTTQGKSVFLLEFELTAGEVAQFRQTTGSNLNGTLPIRIEVDDSDCEIKVYKKGPGGPALTKKSSLIARFVSARVTFQHIRAVRTAENALEVVEAMVSAELSNIEDDPEYQQALSKLEELQRPVLDALADRIRKTLSEFLPQVSRVSITIPDEEQRSAIRRACVIEVDDGTPTALQYKGDGVQSLAALALMRHATTDSEIRRTPIVAIEEPESHLHPGAIHALKTVITELAKTNQVVLTTHCPLFVDRQHVKANILVTKNRARPAKSIEEVREILGVRAADNLRAAELVLVVEGEDDRISLRSILSDQSSSLAAALRSNVLALDSIGGAGKLDYKLGLLRDALCTYHCFLDDDSAGRAAAESAKAQGLLADPELNFAVCNGMPEAEFEDLLRLEFYAGMIKNSYGVVLEGGKFKSSKKWSERMGAAFRAQGKQWNDAVKTDVKSKVAHLVATTPQNCLLQPKRAAIDALIAAIERRLAEAKLPVGPRASGAA